MLHVNIHIPSLHPNRWIDCGSFIIFHLAIASESMFYLEEWNMRLRERGESLSSWSNLNKNLTHCGTASAFDMWNFGLQNFARITASFTLSESKLPSSPPAYTPAAAELDAASVKQSMLVRRFWLQTMPHTAPLSLGSMFQPQKDCIPGDSKSQESELVRPSIDGRKKKPAFNSAGANIVTQSAFSSCTS